ncbi:MAG: LysM peptidoglycan-binding domain-containing protein [Tannerella sp.]|nr:LysM peptidoglycan-binding domain-containing protein [Tannerella sp.]
MKRITLVFFICCMTVPVFAQDEDSEEVYSALSSDSSYAAIGLMPEVLDANVKNLLESWHARYFSKTESHCLDEDENVSCPDEVYRQRLAQMPFVVPMTYNPMVRKCIDLYAGRRRDLMRYVMGMADVYFPIFEQILDQYGLPLELKYLAVVESALNPKALSRVGAAGLWQFMLPTGKIYGLEINSLIDERLDVHKATHAACRYFQEMYEVYGDWHYVLAAYNCGPGSVDKAIRRSGGKTNFWDIFPYLPRETRSYVPLFIAVSYVMTYHCEHNLCPIRTTLSSASDTLTIHRMLHLRQVAEALNVDFEQISMLNPQYKREIIPGNIMPSALKLPVEAVRTFIDREDSVYLHRVEELLANCKPADLSGDPAKDNRETVRHTVQKGENLTVIANRYGVTAREIRRWNKLGYSNRVAAGRRLVIHVDNGGITYAAGRETGEAEKKNDAVPVSVKKPVAETTTTTKQPSVSRAATPDSGDREGGKTVLYTVQAGDSLYSISKKYPGVTVNRIQAANQMKDNKLRIGQVLKIPVG